MILYLNYGGVYTIKYSYTKLRLTIPMKLCDCALKFTVNFTVCKLYLYKNGKDSFFKNLKISKGLCLSQYLPIRNQNWEHLKGLLINFKVNKLIGVSISNIFLCEIYI